MGQAENHYGRYVFSNTKSSERLTSCKQIHVYTYITIHTSFKGNVAVYKILNLEMLLYKVRWYVSTVKECNLIADPDAAYAYALTQRDRTRIGACALERAREVCLASVPGLASPRSVRVLIMRRRQTFENRGRPGLKYHVR